MLKTLLILIAIAIVAIVGFAQASKQQTCTIVVQHDPVTLEATATNHCS